MAKSAFVRARVEQALKEKAENILSQLGITQTQAIVMLYNMIILEEGWPLPLNLPNRKTRKVLKETDEGKGLIECKDIEDLFKHLDI